jgi:ribosomal-protein-alanine N-acetyltransferase
MGSATLTRYAWAMQQPGASARGVSVRAWSPADDDFVATLAQEAFSEYDARPARYMLRVTHRSTTRAWIALEHGDPVGMLVLDTRADTWWVLGVAVTARSRARGVGNLLMQTAEQHASEHGTRRIGLFTADSNLAALDLFLRRGFRIAGRRTRFYAGGQDACELFKLW